MPNTEPAAASLLAQARAAHKARNFSVAADYLFRLIDGTRARVERLASDAELAGVRDVGAALADVAGTLGARR